LPSKSKALNSVPRNAKKKKRKRKVKESIADHRLHIQVKLNHSLTLALRDDRADQHFVTKAVPSRN
jgi:hypothetical protein